MARKVETAIESTSQTPSLRLGQCLELRILRLATGGDGVAKAPDGRTVFVPLSAPDDLLEVQIVDVQRRFLRAEILKILSPGPARAQAPCSVFGVCGGCAWQHLEYPAQVEAKRTILADTLSRIGGVTLDQVPIVMPSPRGYGYRARARLLAGAGESGFRARRSHRLCATTACPVLAPALESALEDVRRLSAADPEPVEWEIASGSHGPARCSRVGEKTASPMVIQIEEDEIQISPGTFAQANALLWGDLHRRVLDATGRGQRALELYAGAGFFTLALARRFSDVTVIESAASAIADLRQNLARAGLDHVEVILASVEAILSSRRFARPDVVLLDPPRAGLAESALKAVADLRAQKIVYLSCDPATLARDTARFVERGYRVASVEGFDLFPQTPHLEALVVLEPSRRT